MQKFRLCERVEGQGFLAKLILLPIHTIICFFVCISFHGVKAEIHPFTSVCSHLILKTNWEADES